MRKLFAQLFGRRRTGTNQKPSAIQAGLWSGLPSSTTPAPAVAPEAIPPGPATPSVSAAGKNPFATPHVTPGRKPLFMPGRAVPPGSFWSRLLGRFGWPPASARRRLFPTSNQLELVLGRPNPPARNRNLEIGVSARVRRSDASASISKVIYESKPATAADAARMTEESDRAYTRLRGRRLESLRVDED